MTPSRRNRHKRWILIVGALALVLGALNAYVNTAALIPPPDVPPDGHNPDQVLALGSVIETPTPEAATLFASVAAFHESLAASGDDVPSSVCLNCHGDIFDVETVTRKMPAEGGSLTATEDLNHHKLHRERDFLAFADQCTYCHIEYDTQVADSQVTIAAYVEKTTCAACHSRFSPRGFMEVSYYEESGCPGCHDGAWQAPHENTSFAPFMVIEHFRQTQRECFRCHGENPNQMPLFLQDLFWQNRPSNY